MKNFKLMGDSPAFTVYKSKDCGVVLKNDNGTLTYLCKIFKNGKAIIGKTTMADVVREGLEPFLERLRAEVKTKHKTDGV
jgi:hypothetical protein